MYTPTSESEELTATGQTLSGGEQQWEPPEIENVKDTGLNYGFLSDLVLKVMYFRGQVSGFEISEEIRLPFETVTRPVVDFLRREQMCEVKGSTGLAAGSFQYVLSTKGMTRAREQLDRSAYVGPAPVTWEQYTESIKAQGTRRLQVNAAMMREALSHLVL
ncbi:MAG: hypothetical protein R3300_15415, partial [Candidatus Promineifilaceae bacterium]|nr:hypothetical protein [Candidatus Promineifilaceae bacterium]